VRFQFTHLVPPSGTRTDPKLHTHPLRIARFTLETRSITHCSRHSRAMAWCNDTCSYSGDTAVDSLFGDFYQDHDSFCTCLEPVSIDMGVIVSICYQRLKSRLLHRHLLRFTHPGCHPTEAILRLTWKPTTSISIHTFRPTALRCHPPFNRPTPFSNLTLRLSQPDTSAPTLAIKSSQTCFRSCLRHSTLQAPVFNLKMTTCLMISKERLTASLLKAL
jgi:hypothetical protein